VKTIPLHPVLLALFPALALYSRNQAYASLEEVATAILATVGGVLGIWAIAGILLRDLRRGAAVASAIGLLFFAYGWVVEGLNSVGVQAESLQRPIGLGLWLVASMVAAIGISLRRWDASRQCAFLNLFAAILVAFPLIEVERGRRSIPRTLPSTVEARAPWAVSERPDIVYIVIDGYGRSDALRGHLGYDNRAFLQALEERGFGVSQTARTNYSQTELSVASALNMDYIQRLLPGVRADETNRVHLRTLIDRNEVARRLRSIGYDFVAITSGFPAIEPMSADAWFRGEGSARLFRSALLESTPLRTPRFLGSPMYEQHRRNLLSAFEAIENVSGRSLRPRFVFAHILAPHPPFVFDAEGRPVQPDRGFNLCDGSDFFDHGGTEEEYIRGYSDQLTFVNRRLLEAIDRLLATGRDPILILQGDHGSKLKLHQNSLDQTDVEECFPILMSVRAPESVLQELETIETPVNLFRAIFRAQFGADLSNLPEHSYFATWPRPFDFVEIHPSGPAPVQPRHPSDPSVIAN
jgi:hypothetical protein